MSFTAKQNPSSEGASRSLLPSRGTGTTGASVNPSGRVWGCAEVSTPVLLPGAQCCWGTWDVTLEG